MKEPVSKVTTENKPGESTPSEKKKKGEMAENTPTRKPKMTQAATTRDNGFANPPPEKQKGGQIVDPPTQKPKSARAAPSQGGGFTYEPDHLDIECNNKAQVYHDTGAGKLTVHMKKGSGTPNGVLAGVRFDAGEDSKYKPPKSLRPETNSAPKRRRGVNGTMKVSKEEIVLTHINQAMFERLLHFHGKLDDEITVEDIMYGDLLLQIADDRRDGQFYFDPDNLGLLPTEVKYFHSAQESTFRTFVACLAHRYVGFKMKGGSTSNITKNTVKGTPQSFFQTKDEGRFWRARAFFAIYEMHLANVAVASKCFGVPPYMVQEENDSIENNLKTNAGNGVQTFTSRV